MMNRRHTFFLMVFLAFSALNCSEETTSPSPADVSPVDTSSSDTGDATTVPDTSMPDTTQSDVGLPDAAQDVGSGDVPAPPDASLVDIGSDAGSSDDSGTTDAVTPSDTGTIDAVQPPPTSEEAQLLKFINHVDTTKNVLVGEVGLKGQTPGAILDYRAGADGLLNTADDVSISSVQELDELPYVGSKSLDKMWAFALNWSEVNLDPVLTLLNAPTLSLAQLDVTWGLDADAASSLMAYRSGVDAVLGTADDQFFINRTDVLEVTYVGKAAVAALESAAGLGTLKLLDSGTAAGMVDVAMNEFGEALIVGTPVGLSGHVFWYTPFSEEAYTSEDEPYEFIDLSELMPEALTGADYDASNGVGYAVGEAPGLYVFDPFIQDVSFVSKPDIGLFSDVAVDALSGDVYAASADSEVIVRFDGIALSPEVVSSMAVNALSYTGSDSALLTGVGDSGALTLFDATGPVTTTVGSGEVLYDVAPLAAPYHRLVSGGSGLATTQSTDWSRIPTRTLRAIRGSALSPDGDTVLLVGEGGTVLVSSLSSGSIAPITAPVSVDFSAVVFSPDGKALLVGDSGVVLEYLPPETP